MDTSHNQVFFRFSLRENKNIVRQADRNSHIKKAAFERAAFDI
jgi:hypothetical protein